MNFLNYKCVYFEEEYLMCLKCYNKNKNIKYITCNEQLAKKYDLLLTTDYYNINYMYNNWSSLLYLSKNFNLLEKYDFVGFSSSRVFFKDDNYIDILKNNGIVYCCWKHNINIIDWILKYKISDNINFYINKYGNEYVSKKFIEMFSCFVCTKEYFLNISNIILKFTSQFKFKTRKESIHSLIIELSKYFEDNFTKQTQYDFVDNEKIITKRH